MKDLFEVNRTVRKNYERNMNMKLKMMKKNMTRRAITACILLAAMPACAQVYVATTGNDDNPGTKEQPLLTIQKAVDMVEPGDTVWVTGGQYLISERIKIPQKATSPQKRCYLWALPGTGEVIIDGSAMHHTTEQDFKMGRCIYLDHLANYWHIKGITMCNAEDNGMKVEGSYNIIENCIFRDNNDTGLQIGMYKDFTIEETKTLPPGEPKFNPGYQFCRNNVVINCDSYNNADLRTYKGTDDGGDADGFACKLFPGPGTEFHGCRAWTNSDDNWDLYMVYHPVVIDSCWSYHAGYSAEGIALGNGNGFKLGGGGTSGGAAFPQSLGAHVVKNCISFGNLHRGFDQNHAYEGMYLFNNLAWNNEINYHFPDAFKYGGMLIRNSIGFKASSYNHDFIAEGKEGSQKPDTEFNSWTTLDGCNPYKEGQSIDGKKPKTKDYSDQFVSLSVEDFMAPRQADGSLPDNGFGKLNSESVFKDKGEPVMYFVPKRHLTEEDAKAAGLELVEADFVTIPYNDAAPEFGVSELPGTPVPVDPTIVKAKIECATANAQQEIIRGNSIQNIIYTMSHADSYIVTDLPAGTEYSVDGNVITIYGTPTEAGTFHISVEGKYNEATTFGSLSLVPPSHVLTGDWYHFQDDMEELPTDISSIIKLVDGSDSSHPSKIDPTYTESGSIPAGCTQGALVMGRSGGGITWTLPTGVMDVKLNLHFTGSRSFKIAWQTADGKSHSKTTAVMAKGTYTSWNLLSEAGITLTEQPVTITFTNQSTGGEVRMYDMYVRVPDTPAGIEDIVSHTRVNNRIYNLRGQMVKQPHRGIYIVGGKKYLVK